MRSDIFAAFFGVGLEDYLFYVNIGRDEGFSMDMRMILLWSIFEGLMVCWHFRQPLTQYRCSVTWKQIMECLKCHLCKYTGKIKMSTEISGSYFRRKCLHVT